MSACQICFHKYDVFRVLKCGHWFCENCLKEIVKDEKLPCPNCRAEHLVSSVNSLPKKHCGRITCPTCNNDKSIESDFVWCHECCKSVCGMCFLTNHDQKHKFTKWNDDYPAVSECISYFESKLDRVNLVEDEALKDYFQKLRLTVNDEVRSGTNNIKKPLENILAILKHEFPTANSAYPAKLMNDEDVSSTIKQIAKISHVNLNYDVFDDASNINGSPLCEDIIGVHRHFCFPNLLACFNKPVSTYEVPNLDDFTVIRDEIFQVNVANGGHIKIGKIHSADFSGKLYSVYGCVNVGRHLDEIIIVTSNTINCSVFNVDSKTGLIRGSKSYNGNFFVVESQTNLYGFMNGGIALNVELPYMDVVKLNVSNQKFICAVEKLNVVQFIFVDYHSYIDIVFYDKDDRHIVEQRKIEFEYLLRKGGLMSEVQSQQTKRITAICPFDSEIVDFLIVAVEFMSRINQPGSSSFFLYDVHCGTVRFLQNFKTLVFQKLLIREKTLYCLVDLNEEAKKRFMGKTAIVAKRLFIYHLP